MPPVPVITLVGGSNGCFGGMGIVARCTNAVIMSEEGRLAMSGPEVIETANGVEEFDSRDRALVWRTTGGKHRYLIGDCDIVVPDDIARFRDAALQQIDCWRSNGTELTLESLEREQHMLRHRLDAFGDLADPMDIWRELHIDASSALPLLEADAFVEHTAKHRILRTGG